MSTEVKVHQRDTFEIIRSAVGKTADLIAPTFGPAGNKVIISKVTHKVVVDDGVQIARDLELSDPAENAVLQVVRETAIRTNDRVGDGTTGSIIMLRAIVEEVAKMGRFDGRKIERELKAGLAQAIEQLEQSAHPIKTKEDLLKVARISFDNPEIAEVIADTWFRMGRDGVITLETSGNMKTYADIAEGVTMSRGYLDPNMVNNPSRMECVLERPYVLLTDYRLTEWTDIMPAMNLLLSTQKSNLFIVCDSLEGSALATAVVNNMQNKFYTVAINKPQADNDTVALEDLALLLGGKVFSMRKGDKLEDVKLEDFGRADKIICRAKESIIVKPHGSRALVKQAVSDLNMAILATDVQKEKDALQRRVATFTNKVAVIKVGAPTQNEMRALHYKIEDSVNAVRAAYRGGIVCGGGLALSRLSTSSQILNDALQAPFAQLKVNVGLGAVSLKPGEAINVVTGKVGKFMDVGVIDPVDVLIAGIDSAVSIASMLITTSGLIVESPKQIRQEQAGE